VPDWQNDPPALPTRATDPVVPNCTASVKYRVTASAEKAAFGAPPISAVFKLGFTSSFTVVMVKEESQLDAAVLP
jgi:hypothetical protein